MSSVIIRRLSRLGCTTGVVAMLGLASAATAAASTTIGQLAPGYPPDAPCADSRLELIQTSADYVVPAGGVAITSWSINASAGLGQQMKMKVWRKIADPATYQVVGQDGPRMLSPVGVNTFAVNIPVQPGDVIGTNFLNGFDINNACIFDSPGNFVLAPTGLEDGDFNNGESRTFVTDATDSSLNLRAVVGFKPSNKFKLGKVKRNKKKGTATLSVKVPGPGTLSLTGKGVRRQRTGRAARAVISKTATKAGTVKLAIKPKSKLKAKLNDRGKAKVKVTVTYTPDGRASGDVIGTPNKKAKRLKLLKGG